MSDQPAVLRITEPGEVAQVVPHLLGFQPEESLVILVLEQGRIQVTARIDIDAAQPPEQAEHLLDRIWARFPDADALAIAYTNQPRTGWDLLRRCQTHLGPRTDTSLMLVSGETWRTPDGQTGTVDRYGPLAAEATLQGLPVLPSRTELDARFASATITDDLLAQVEPALASLPAHDDNPALISLAADLINQHLPTPNPGRTTSRIDTPAALQLAVVTQNPAVRDLALLSMTANNAEQHLRLWRDVVNQTPNVIAEAPLFLAGMAAWLTGDGASAVVALERSQASARSDRQVSGLLDALIDQVVPPSAWPDMRDQILHHAEPKVRDTLTRDTHQPPLWETVERPDVRRPPNPTSRGRKPPAPGIAI
ncbi:MAG: hypothetical protein CVT65_18445 [Actinobacteria bacterium HGW-Actinobacteria-5]|jgi:hypothetical protein|nr:MAG: hypothetical protein CVT65_18445 [Actinobacteria bacterium HGW-Actinobacteria-5]